MIYMIEAFDRKTGFLDFEEKIPEGQEERTKQIMGWANEQEGWEGYNLTRAQLSKFEEILGKEIYRSSCIFQITCNDY
ncbi:hypothetical protein J3P80_01525 [Pseudomonas sp. D2-30]|uniref:DUF7683 domain-containing protein n=1 Tax=unclassified Pseudomonas TaxID=196821 RepID=UPI003DA7D07C